MLSPDQINALAQSITGILPPEYLALRSPSDLNTEAQAALALHLDRCQDLAFATTFQSTIGLASPPDYLNRLLFIDNHILLCGIRFFAASPAHPFVDLLAWSPARPNLSDSPLSPDLTPADLAHIAPALIQAFAPFKPLAIRILTRGVTPPVLDPHPPHHHLPNWTTRGDQVVTAATLEHICAQPLPAGFSNIDLIDITLDQALAFMDMAYAHLRASQPFLASRVPPAPREGLIECFDHGRLCFWRLHGETAGIIAVKPQNLHGLKGYLVEEEIVNPAHSGRGTASIAQRHLAESLLKTHPHSHYLSLFGSIDMANPSSRRTAARTGRQELLSWWFLSRPNCKI